MRRILSLVVALVLVLGTVSVFAVSADWAGYYRVKFRSTSTDPKDSAADLRTYMWQKLELFPSFTLSDNVKISAGFFHQQYWGAGRLVNTGTGDPIQQDTGGYAGAYSSTNSDNPLINDTNVKTSLGVSAAWATLTFMEGKLGIDVGRRKNPEWGTGAFFGGPFNPDRIFITYKTPGMGGLMIPYFIYERRTDTNIENSGDNANQLLAGLIYVAPGKTLFGLTATWVATGDNYQRSGNSTVGGSSGAALANGTLYAVDVYVDHKFTLGFGTIKPIFEIVYATGEVADKNFSGKTDYLDGTFTAGEKAAVYADVLNFILKADIAMPKLVTLTPEVAFQKAPKDAEGGKWYSNFWGVNEYAGSLYTVGNIYNGTKGGTNAKVWLTALGMDLVVKSSNTYYAKLNVSLDLLDEVVSGLSANVYGIYAAQFSGVTYQSGTKNDEKGIVTEFGLGIAYSIDKATTVSADFAYAKWGKGHFVSESGGEAEATSLYLGADLTVKF